MLTLSQRLTFVFTSLLLLCCALSGWTQIRASTQYGNAMIQQLSADLASHIVSNSNLMIDSGINQQAMKELFSQLMTLNPSVEVYLLDKHGNIIADAAPEGHLMRSQVTLAPLKTLIEDKNLPIYGDDPRSISAKKVFSVAPIASEGELAGYLYVILQGENYKALARAARSDTLLKYTLWSMGFIVLLGLVAGHFAFRWVTRPIRQLTHQVSKLDRNSMAAMEEFAHLPKPSGRLTHEVDLLHTAFIELAQRIAEQWNKLASQDQLRREFVANISHDLRTPLMSLHGYLETLSIKSSQLKEEDRVRYLTIALNQSRKVGLLAQQLFELARLEYGVVKPRKERFSLCELVQDVFQKFELAAETRQQKLLAHIQPGLMQVNADLSMIERVLTNLIDNSLRHTPEKGIITVRLWQQGDYVMMELQDSGPGIPLALRQDLFNRPSILSSATARRHHSGGLGLMIVRRILLLHNSDIILKKSKQGACFEFAVPTI